MAAPSALASAPSPAARWTRRRTKPKLPEAGKHCDSVPGHTLSGGETF
jgi:hypothetical protein